MDGGAVDLLQLGHHADGLQEVKEIIQQGPFIQSVDPIHKLFAV